MVQKEKYLGEFEQVVMLALLHLGKEAYGANIRQLLQRQIERDVSLGALYSTLERLENKGMVISELGESTPQRGGRPKRFFEVTATGNKALLKARQAMETMWQGISLYSL